jgi:dTDP-4-dehydrorhamnose 3,5-epimerase
MKFTALALTGAYLIELEPHLDERGSFARTFCKHEFEVQGLMTHFVQMSTSFNHKKGQIRGMHYQESPFSETKIVRCTRGSIYDVILDIRPHSPTYMQSYGTVLTPDNAKMFYIPKGFAHGFKTLENNTEIFYMMDEFYHPDKAREISISNYFDE